MGTRGTRLFVSTTVWESARQLGMQRGEVPIKVSTRTNRSQREREGDGRDKKEKDHTGVKEKGFER